MRAPSLLIAAVVAVASPLPAWAATGERPGWDSLIERGLGKDGIAFLVDSGSRYVDRLQTPEQVEASDAEGIPIATARVEEITAYYMAAVAPTIRAQYERAFADTLSQSDMALLLDKSADDAGQASFACLFQSAPGPDGKLAFDACGANSSPAYRGAAQSFLDAFNAALTSRTLNDAFGGATCRALDDVVAAYNTDIYELTINGSIGLGTDTARECSLLKVRWAGLAGYDWLMASKEFGE